MKVAFLDRDGVINKEVNYLHQVNDFEYTENSIQGMLNFLELGYKIIVITNQAGIAKGYYTETDYQKLTDWFLNDLKTKGVYVLDVFYCPHHNEGIIHPYNSSCLCRKPATGMIDKAKEIYDIDLKSSILVGDKVSDVKAGMSAGVGRNYLVNTGHFIPSELHSRYMVFNDLLEISKKI